MLDKEKLQQIKLTTEENIQLNDFIGKSVRNNRKFTVMTNRVGVSPNNGIQELYNQNIETLVTYAGLLDKQIKGHTVDFDPLGDGSTEMMLGDLKARDVLFTLTLIIREKTYNRALANRVVQLKLIQVQIDDLKTPEEKRRALELQLHQLQELA